MRSEKDGIAQWDQEEVAKKLDDESITFVDIREPEEYNEGHIPGVPLLPMGEVPDHIDGMDKEKTHVFICRSGTRSQKVAQYAKQQGLDRAINFDGGMLSWDGDTKTGEEKRVQETSDIYK
ncbi:rhodanese-related sulfurtransferase [Geomicrobium halophilum]|uniref:Rhodanese-related sulfurtransferase n=1 Tax=Geomicrobium halophilum TaxID=549000 RepID=A0A841PX03_9BACL|nr:rhodanese-like domain-containing protein [Geomicrobium halophilum]MBB6448445.1 rhodanese-related sulfurtransferase [Geomicrobium halophilum]